MAKGETPAPARVLAAIDDPLPPDDLARCQASWITWRARALGAEWDSAQNREELAAARTTTSAARDRIHSLEWQAWRNLLVGLGAGALGTALLIAGSAKGFMWLLS